MEYVCGLFDTSTIVLHQWPQRQYTLIGVRGRKAPGRGVWGPRPVPTEGLTTETYTPSDDPSFIHPP